jgi:hypothetical protein
LRRPSARPTNHAPWTFDKTIDDLRALIEQAVRDEQPRHQLIGLPNASAMDEQSSARSMAMNRSG